MEAGLKVRPKKEVRIMMLFTAQITPFEPAPISVAEYRVESRTEWIFISVLRLNP